MSIIESILTKNTLYFLFILITILIILYIISVGYTEAQHDLPLVTFFTVTELDLFCYDPDGMLNDIIILLYQGIVVNQYINNRRY